MSTPMFDMHEHFPIGVDADGQGPLQEHDPRYARTVCWCGTPGCKVYEHVLHVEGPMRYPGGKDGMYHVVCSCKAYMSPPGATASSRRMWEAAEKHQAAKAGL
jgi:hypothetical protein